MTDFDFKYKEYINQFNSELDVFCARLKCNPELLNKSLIYSLQLGGKRIRPVLMLAVGDVLMVDRQKLMPFALALEIIHTYSLIHDDLPAMDNDDFRRGKPSNHKVFGEANAILAGDGLLNTAYSVLFDECFKGNEYISAAKYICDCAGIYGMIAGQSADITNKSGDAIEDKLNFIYENKTSKLIMAATVVPSILNGGKYYPELKTLGKKFGYLFQLTDDILDVEGNFAALGKSIGKDESEGKLTGVSLYGLDNCKLRVDIIGDDCNKIIDGINGDTSFLYDFVNFIKTRVG